MYKRLLCRVLGHDARKVPRDDEGGGYSYECRRCGAEGIRPRPQPSQRPTRPR